jgi:hypothetical protein
MVSWRHNPRCKVEAGSTEISSDFIDVAVHRPENAVSTCILNASDYKGRNFIGNLDAFTVLKVSFRCGSDSWSKVFEGEVEKVGPVLSEQGWLVQATANGYGANLRDTHCEVHYGSQISSSLDVPEEIWDDIIDNHVNKSLGTADNTGYAITKTKIKAITSPTIPFLDSGYRSNLQLVDLLCDFYNAVQAGSAGVHWFVDPSKNLWVDTIGAHTVDATNWPTWWNTDQANSTLTEGVDLKSYFFTKNIRNFANKVVVCSDFRKPGYDYWTEGQSSRWGQDVSFPPSSLTDDAGDKVVGANSLNVYANNATCYIYWPGGSLLTGDAASGQKDVTVADATYFKVGDIVHIHDLAPNDEECTVASIAGSTLTMSVNLTNAYTVLNSAKVDKYANWDLTKIGSEETIPTVNFYFKKDADLLYVDLRFYHTDITTDYYYVRMTTAWPGDPNGEWVHRTIPIGPYYKNFEETQRYRWTDSGSAVFNWNDCNGIGLLVQSGVGVDTNFLIDDWHIAGKIIREAYNSTNISSNKERQKVFRFDVAIDDTLKEADDSGTAAMLAYNELLLRQTTPVVGQLVTPLAIDALPGQLLHVHADKQHSGVHRVDSNFRAKEIIHVASKSETLTSWDVTDDVTNTHAVGFLNPVRILANLYRIDPEAQNLKSSGIDVLVERLSKDYP